MPKAERRYTTYERYRHNCGWRDVLDTCSVCDWDNEGNECYRTKPHRCHLWSSMHIVKETP